MACEALTNAVKHEVLVEVTVRAVQDSGTLHVTVADDEWAGAISGSARLRPRQRETASLRMEGR